MRAAEDDWDLEGELLAEGACPCCEPVECYTCGALSPESAMPGGCFGLCWECFLDAEALLGNWTTTNPTGAQP